ncbi:MAG: A/G-specific adenine glycosylase [Chloroflexota bacterium]
MERLRDALLGWHVVHGRDLPWRRTRDPYAILVSEVMLQQTQVDRVAPKYEQWLGVFPSFGALASAPLSEAIRLWAPLGYNRRPVRLHRIAVHVVEKLGGRLPPDPVGLVLLEGIGRYTANAVASFAFDFQVAVVDTNVSRVVRRLFGRELGSGGATPRAVDGAAQRLLPAGRAYEWNQAMMDLGATVCSARAPSCLVCPLMEVCETRGEGVSVEAKRAAESAGSYVAEEPFRTSARFYRGRIVDALRALAAGRRVRLAELAEVGDPSLGELSSDRLEELVAALAKDGLVVMDEAGGIALP